VIGSSVTTRTIPASAFGLRFCYHHFGKIPSRAIEGNYLGSITISSFFKSFNLGLKDKAQSTNFHDF
jgi:hypothetical protein